MFHGVAPGRIGPDPRFAGALATVVARLDAVRRAERRALAAGKYPDARAGHAEVLASAYATASAQVESLAGGPHEQPVETRLVRAFGRARDGYVLLGAALRARDHRGYIAASRKVTAADRAGNATLRSLARLGYSPRG
jgi:hypothetical protein